MTNFTLKQWQHDSYLLKCNECGVNVDLRQIVLSKWDEQRGAHSETAELCESCFDKMEEREEREEREEQEEREDMSDLDKLFEKCKESVCWDEYEGDKGLKFSFAFALLKICSECHDGMGSHLYALMSALSLEWDFEPNCACYDEDDCEQKECFEFLLDELEVRGFYNEQ